MDDLNSLMMKRSPTAARPLMGLTVLVVEDSRYACDAMRLLCLRSGARIRRADSLEHARRHLRIYRPSVLIVDEGLPDGSGVELVKELNNAPQRMEVILAISGDPAMEAPMREAGADGFLEKPIANLATFQAAILDHLPAERHPRGPRLTPDEVVSPDSIAYRDDLAHVADVLKGDTDDQTIDYLTRFLNGIARAASDAPLTAAVDKLSDARKSGNGVGAGLAHVASLVENRLNEQQAPI